LGTEYRPGDRPALRRQALKLDRSPQWFAASEY
jgi:hypothetical protein